MKKQNMNKIEFRLRPIAQVWSMGRSFTLKHYFLYV